MNDEIVLIDYADKYADIINSIKIQQWGNECIRDIKEVLKEDIHIKLAQCNDEIVGVGYGKRIGDVFYIEVIVIKPEYQHNHIGSMFMEYFINYSKALDLANIVCEGVLENNKMNIENLMKKYKFKEIIRIKEYWGYRHPNDWCKECNSKPCKCTNVIFAKELI